MGFRPCPLFLRLIHRPWATPLSLAPHHGRVTLDQLPFLLVGAEVPASGPDIEEAIEQVLPGAEEADSPLDFRPGGVSKCWNYPPPQVVGLVLLQRTGTHP